MVWLYRCLQQVIPAAGRERLHRRWQRWRASFVPEPYRTVLPYTMVGLDRLRTLDLLVREIDQRGIAGDVVECGTCNGGSAAILARVASRSPHDRHTWLFDSFAGLPPASLRDGSSAAEYTGLCCGSQQNVHAVLQSVGVSGEAVTLVPGWFQDTLPSFKVPRIALLHIDADWYDSVRLCLDHLYDRVTPGGFVIFDDFGYWQGCREAWRDFEVRRNLSIPLTHVDGIGVWLRKPEVESTSAIERAPMVSSTSPC